jgi:diacylglycerol kinase family enzyme
VTAADLGTPRAPARHPVLIMNPVSGGGKVEQHGLVQECRSRGVEPIVMQAGDDLTQLAEDAIAGGADVIGMAGGDGSQALVADVARRHGIPLVVVPAGTRNHLALDLGLDREDVVGALEAFRGGVPRRIDLATVNGRIFVNNASLGLYAQIVSSEAYRDAKLRTTFETLPDLLGPGSEMLDLAYRGPDDRPLKPGQVVLISNNPYTWQTLGGAGTRARLDTGELGIVSLSLSSPTDARRFLALETAGQISRFSGWLAWNAPRFEVGAQDEVAIALDGEAMTMKPPLEFEILPGAVTVLLPPDAPGRSPAARTLSHNTPAALWRLARGGAR